MSFKVDIHVHPMLIKDDMNSYEESVNRLLGCMDRVGLDKVNAMPMILNNGMLMEYLNEKDILFCAEFLKKIMKEHGDRFFSMLWVNPNLSLEFLKRTIQKYVIDGSINGVKLLADMNAADERLEPLAGFLEEHDIPVLFHCWYKTVNKGYSESDPSEIACLAGKFPSLRITMAHLRGCRFRGVQDIKRHHNIWVDTSGSDPEDGYLEYALKELGPDRIIHGTDYPGRDFATALGRIDSLEMEPDIKGRILGGNAVKFLGRDRT